MTKTIIGGIGGFAAVTVLWCAFPNVDIPNKAADALRGIVLAKCFFGLGLLSYITMHLARIKIDFKDQALTPLRGLAISYIMSTLILSYVLIDRFGQPIGWFTPAVFASFLLADVCLIALARQIRRVGTARVSQHVVTVVPTDTGKIKHESA